MQYLIQFCDLIPNLLNYGFDVHMVSGSLDAKGEAYHAGRGILIETVMARSDSPPNAHGR